MHRWKSFLLWNVIPVWLWPYIEKIIICLNQSYFESACSYIILLLDLSLNDKITNKDQNCAFNQTHSILHPTSSWTSNTAAFRHKSFPIDDTGGLFQHILPGLARPVFVWRLPLSLSRPQHKWPSLSVILQYIGLRVWTNSAADNRSRTGPVEACSFTANAALMRLNIKALSRTFSCNCHQWPHTRPLRHFSLDFYPSLRSEFLTLQSFLLFIYFQSFFWNTPTCSAQTCIRIPPKL